MPAEHSSTLVSNSFIDQYMADAPGEYVKVYLYALRSVGKSGCQPAASQIAEALCLSENCANAALSYWADLGLFDLFMANGAVTDIMVQEPYGAAQAAAPASVPLRTAQMPRPSAAARSATRDDAGKFSFFLDSRDLPQPQRRPAPQKKPSASRRKVSLVPFDSSMLHDKDTRLIMLFAERYMKKRPTAKEKELLNFWHEELAFSSDTIESLLATYVCEQGMSIEELNQLVLSSREREEVLGSYQETEGNAEAEPGMGSGMTARTDPESGYSESCGDSDGISAALQGSVQPAADLADSLQQIRRTIGYARAFLPAEERFLATWMQDYGFGTDMIIEAFDRCILKLGEPKFEYTDSILKRWKAEHIHTLAQAQQAKKDWQAAQKARYQAGSSRPAGTLRGGSGTGSALSDSAYQKLHSFNERSYDMGELEKKLLQKTY